MIQVKNKKAIRNLANKSFRANRMRNGIAALAIAMTTVLFTAIFTMGMGAADVLQKASMRQSGGDGHAALKYITDEQFEKVKDHPLIKEIAYDRVLCDGVENEEFLKRRAEFWYHDAVGLKLSFCEVSGGRLPEAENEVIADTKTLELLGVPLQEGAPLTLELMIRGQKVTRQFVLSGWYESDPLNTVGSIYASKAYVDAHEEELRNTMKEDLSMTGCITARIMFGSSFGLEDKLERVIEESGFSLDQSAPNYIESNVNWAYLSTNMSLDPTTVIMLLGAVTLVVFSGYLIIYNIFQISVIKDIRFYGLLKTIGTTKRQIRRMIRRQALLLTGLGIPPGLLAGYAAGKFMVPLLISRSNYAGTTAEMSPSPWMFLGAALFSVITVFISTAKPGRTAGSVTPIQAVRYTENGLNISGTAGNKKRRARTSSGGMALSNLGRNRKRTALVLLSLSLSLVLLNTIFTLSDSIDTRKFMEKFNKSDFLAAHAEYFGYGFSGKEQETSQSLIEAVEARPEFVEGGRIYGGRAEGFRVAEEGQDPASAEISGDRFAAVYGAEGLALDNLELIDGELDLEKLSSGEYVLEGLRLDDNGRVMMETKHYEVGETVTLCRPAESSDETKEREYVTVEVTVLGHVKQNVYTNTDGVAWNYCFYLTGEGYKKIAGDPAVMNYSFNVREGTLEDMEAFLTDYTENTEPVMHFTSVLSSMEDVEGMKQIVFMIGGGLSAIVGLIGILNFINAVLTGIITRKKEFAMLRSIGMTEKQLRRMLIFEGIYYTVGTAALSLLLACVFSLLVVKPACGLLWMMSYKFVVWPLAAVLPLLLALGALIPCAAYAAAGKESIVDQLRQAE